MLDVGSVLHNGVIEGFFVASSFSLGQCLIPALLKLTTEDPAAIVFALKNEQALCVDHQHIDFRCFTFGLWYVDIEKELRAIFLRSPDNISYRSPPRNRNLLYFT